VADFYFDHNISVEIAGLLRMAGHTAVTADEIGLAGATDDEHLLVAAERRSILVSHKRLAAPAMIKADRRRAGRLLPALPIRLIPK
jgi:hypothetical protein